MIERVDLLQAPAEWRALESGELAGVTCVVFDVLRATTTILAALASGATRAVPVVDIAEAVAWRARAADVLLAGEREGLRITAAQSGGVDFDLGNSPREFTAERVRGRTIVTTTTNGTRALRACACACAAEVLLGAFVNLGALTARLRGGSSRRLLLVAAGTEDDAALEDSLAAGALCDRLSGHIVSERLGDAARMAQALYRTHAADLAAAIGAGVNGARLLAQPDLAPDVAFCARIDAIPVVAALDADGSARLV
jgi:2-phosphosulfolactate phosphatase